MKNIQKQKLMDDLGRKAADDAARRRKPKPGLFARILIAISRLWSRS